MISVPFLTPRLSSLWLGLVTPVYARVGRELIAGLKNKSVVTDPTALSVFPIRPASVRDAISRDLGELSEGAPIVHEDHGVGRYRGLIMLDAGGMPAEYL